MSPPVSARNTSATVVDQPGMLHNRSRAAANDGDSASMILVSRSLSAVVQESMRFKCIRIR